MKKRLLCIVLIVSMIACLCGCTPYSEAVNKQTKSDYAGGYFTVIYNWIDTEGHYRLVYANDTRVKYLKIPGGGITPLYNADGSLQVYEDGGE